MKRKPEIKRMLFIGVLLLLIVPLIQFSFLLIKEAPLKGSFKLAELPDSLKSNWFNGVYQEEYGKYFNDHIGFRNFFVRVNNQVQYSLFDKTNAKDLEFGQDGYLFEGGYIRDYMGYSFVGEKKINEKTLKIKKLQKYLSKKSFIIALAPGKASYYPEKLPKGYDLSTKTISNYKYYRQSFINHGVDFIDFNKNFMDLKDEISFPLYSKGGIHWSEYGVALSLDSLTNYLERKRNIKIPTFSYEETYSTKDLKPSDRDIFNAMNLLFDYDDLELTYPKFTFDKSYSGKKLNVLIVGDSYGYNILNTGVTNEIFGKTEFWYYNKEIKPKRKNHSNMVKDVDILNEIGKFDVIIVLSTETNLFKFGFSFIDDFYAAVFKE